MADKRETITVAAGQIGARLMNEAGKTLASLEVAITEAAGRHADLLVLPECAYPAYLLGSLTSYRAGEHLSSEAFVAWLCERAARYRLHIVSGFVEDHGQIAYNGSVLIDDAGREVGRSRKRFLWHVDHDWYEPGDAIEAFDTALGRIGIVICAETRTPEIIATLVADGAELIALPTCWVNGSRQPGEFKNPQIEFIMEARAREFGLPFICANKSGVELPPIGYVGSSRIIRADGSLTAGAPPTGEAVIVAEIERRSPPLVVMSDEHRARLLDNRPAVRPAGTNSEPIRVAALSTRAVASAGEALFRRLRASGVELLMMNVGNAGRARELGELAKKSGIAAIGSADRTDVFQLGPAKAGCVSGEGLSSFAASRVLTLDGAELLMLFDADDDLPILRTRAVENRVFLMAANERMAVVISPDGAVLARSDDDHPAHAVAEINLADTADKCVAPRTDIFDERYVHLYRF